MTLAELKDQLTEQKALQFSVLSVPLNTNEGKAHFNLRVNQADAKDQSGNHFLIVQDCGTLMFDFYEVLNGEARPIYGGEDQAHACKTVLDSLPQPVAIPKGWTPIIGKKRVTWKRVKK